MCTDDASWLADIISNLQNRDDIEVQRYESVFHNYAAIQDQLISLSIENVKLKSDNKLLEKENQNLNSENSCSVRSYDIEQKLFRLQEEVTELHREKGQLAQNVIELTKANQSKDNTLKNTIASLNEHKEISEKLRKLNRTHMEEIKTLKKTNQVLLDEQAATMLTVKSLESKLHIVLEDNRKLLQQVKNLQEELVELRNIEADVKYRLHQKKIEKSLRDAAHAQSSVDNQKIINERNCNIATIPTKLRFQLESTDDINCVCFSPSGTRVCTGGLDRKVRTWKIAGNKCDPQTPLVGCNAAVSAVDFDTKETMVLGASSDFACRVWTLADSRLKINLTGHSERVIAARFIGSDRIVTASADRTIKIWQLEKRQCFRTILAVSACHDVVVCSSIESIISGHFDKRMRIWDYQSGVMTNEVSLSERICGLDISTDGSEILACTRNDSLHTIDLRQLEVIRSFQADGFVINSDFVRPCFSPDRQYVACGSNDGGVYIWNSLSGVLETVLRKHENMVICTNWSPLGDSLVSCERGKKTIVWSQF